MSPKTGQVGIALLRGINVGGKNKLPMADLARIFSEAGCAGARTYIQSGNVVFRAAARTAARLPATVARLVQERFGIAAPVITRTEAELRAIARSNPFLAAGADPKRLHVAFLADAPSKAALATLDPDRSPPDAFAARERELYLSCPNGMARTRFTNAYLDSTLATTCTIRNWNTVLKLLELAEQIG